MDFFSQGLPLGRWFRIDVIIHWTFLLYVANDLVLHPRSDISIPIQVMMTVLLFGTILLHEFGHAFSCRAVGGQADRIILWPLGGLAFVQPPMNPKAWFITTACGPLVNAVLWPLFWAITTKVVEPAIADGRLQGELAKVVYIACWWMWTMNKGLLLFNLIPAYPMDGGRMLQEILWFFLGYKQSLMIAGMVGVAAGAAFIFLGLGIWQITIPGTGFSLGGDSWPMLVIIGFLSCVISWSIYQQSLFIDSRQKR
jgi:Zn-dependent protease